MEDVLRSVQRFRILCVGRSGVGKSHLINCVFGVETAVVAHYKVGEADINQEHTSDQNPFFILHDSKGFEPGDAINFETAKGFIVDRCREEELKDRLHAIWLCVETPRAGGRVLEAGDEKLLKLASDNEVPVVVVFTQYDKLESSKGLEREENNPLLSDEELESHRKSDAQEVYEFCIATLDKALQGLSIQSRHFVKVSVCPGYEHTVEHLVEATRDVVREHLDGDAYIMWAIAQRASLPVKVDACIDKGVDYFKYALAGGVPGLGKILLRECLSKMHQDIVLCWNFDDKHQILISDEFKQLMLYLLQDIAEGPKSTASPEFDKVSQFVNLVTSASAPVAPPAAILGLTFIFVRWLSETVLDKLPDIEYAITAYVVDLISILTSLFDFTCSRRLCGKTEWDVVKLSFESYERSQARQLIHSSCRSGIQDRRQFSDHESFRKRVRELLELA